jgi:hypothetical protein
MRPILICETDEDRYAALDFGWPVDRLFIDPYNLDVDLNFERQRHSLHLYDAIIVTNSQCPGAIEQAEMTAAFLRDLFASVRQLALPGGLAGWIKRGGDVGSL